MPAPRFILVSLRPRADHAALRRAAAAQGGRVLAMSPWCIEALDDPATRHALHVALACPHVVVTSPAAVRAAAVLADMAAVPGQFHAVGEGSRLALQRAGALRVEAPSRMDSEGLLGLPALRELSAGATVGLVTAPGGRGKIPRQLQARGVKVLRADVYRRVPLRIAAGRWQTLAAAMAGEVPVALALTSGEAWAAWRAQCPPGLDVRPLAVVAASARLARLAHEAGCRHVVQATSARPAAVVAAWVAAMPAA